MEFLCSKEWLVNVLTGNCQIALGTGLAGFCFSRGVCEALMLPALSAGQAISRLGPHQGDLDCGRETDCSCNELQQLLAGAKVNELTKHRQTALHLAAQQDLPTICSVLLENGVDFAAVDENGNNGNSQSFLSGLNYPSILGVGAVHPWVCSPWEAWLLQEKAVTGSALGRASNLRLPRPWAASPSEQEPWKPALPPWETIKSHLWVTAEAESTAQSRREIAFVAHPGGW